MLLIFQKGDADKYRKKVIHPEMSSKIAQYLLDGAPLTATEKSVILYLIKHHEKKVTEGVVINQRTYLEKPSQNIDQLAVLIDADALAFFESTIEFFILDRIKTEKMTNREIWARVMDNLKRLNPKLQYYAAQKIRDLSEDAKAGFPGNWLEELDRYMTSVQDKHINKDCNSTEKQYEMETFLKELFPILNFQMSKRIASAAAFSSSNASDSTGSFRSDYIDGIGGTSFRFDDSQPGSQRRQSMEKRRLSFSSVSPKLMIVAMILVAVAIIVSMVVALILRSSTNESKFDISDKLQQNNEEANYSVEIV